MTRIIDSTPGFVFGVYEKVRKNVETVKRRLGRAMTYAEKVFYGHLQDAARAEIRAGESYVLLTPDRVAMQDATAQMALLQFMSAGRPSVAVPTTVHCDHLIQAYSGAAADLETAARENHEVYSFLKSVSAKYGIGFWGPGSGIIHQVILENYAFPGGMMIGTDSHTPNAGGLGMFACGVGGADAVDVMAGFPWEVLHPRLVGVRLTGELSGWASPKDVILWVCGQLTCDGGTNNVVEYFGPGARTISCTGKGTITNMGAELGATTSLFPFDEKMDAYLKATSRRDLADLARKNAELLRADEDVEIHPEKYFRKVLELNLSTLEPHVVGPHTPDLARPVSKMAEAVRKEGYVDDISFSLIGSCTNSSYEDIARAADIAQQGIDHGAKTAAPLMVTPGSEQIRATIERDGLMQKLNAVGGTVLANACGPCIGQWKRADEVGKAKPARKNSILTSYNRNFPKRNDGSAETAAFIASPEVVVAMALGGRMSFNPLTDPLRGADGREWKLAAPKKAPELPPDGFVRNLSGYTAPPEDGSAVAVAVDLQSDRLQILDPFRAWDGKDFVECPLLLKAKGKCTTDHISQAGVWLRFRGHLDKISDNMYLGAINAFTGQPGTTLNQVTGEKNLPVPAVARDYRARGLRWVVVGDQNYGEGSSREHAAMSPRLLGAAAILVKSFARIHETNLKKQGLLPLTFADPADYDRVREGDRISILGLAALAPGKPVAVKLHHADGTAEEIQARQTLNDEQVAWFRAGSALNILKQRHA
ncbi:MAG: aconitate hydratase [Candidatus Brocadiae bacterium]|nr:aconitate hydratase [Candidatus Brocadiia bacterium]